MRNEDGDRHVLSRRTRALCPFDLFLIAIAMSLSRAIGIGVFIIVLKFLAPDVLSEGTDTAVAFLNGAQVSAAVATDLAASAGSIRISNEPFQLPVLPVTRPD